MADAKIDTQQTEVEPENISAPTSKDKCKYKGIVTVKKVRGNKVIFNKTYHNSGSSELFKFLCYSLSGDFKTAKNLIPNKVKLYYNTATTPVEAATVSSLTSRSRCILANSSEVNYSALPNEPGYYDKCWNTTLHFLIPSAYIFTDETNTSGYINEIRLYPNNTTVDGASAPSSVTYSADFKFVDYTDTTSWDPILVQDEKHSYNLLIDWTLTFDNNEDYEE